MSGLPVTDSGDAAERVATAFEAAGIAYAIGGALAMGVHGYPRGTLDVGINVFVEPPELSRVLQVLHDLGLEVDDHAAVDARASRWKVRGALRWFPGRRFRSEHPVLVRGRSHARPHREGYWFLSPEALAVFKLLSFRGKDLVDLERFVAARAERLDHAYVRRWISDMMGKDDERLRAWDQIVARFAPG